MLQVSIADVLIMLLGTVVLGFGMKNIILKTNLKNIKKKVTLLAKNKKGGPEIPIFIYLLILIFLPVLLFLNYFIFKDPNKIIIDPSVGFFHLWSLIPLLIFGSLILLHMLLVEILTYYWYFKAK